MATKDIHVSASESLWSRAEFTSLLLLAAFWEPGAEVCNEQPKLKDSLIPGGKPVSELGTMVSASCETFDLGEIRLAVRQSLHPFASISDLHPCLPTSLSSILACEHLSLPSLFVSSSDLLPCSCHPGFNPNWDEEFTFDIEIPELALVRFVVEDFDMSTKNDFIGQYTLPFTSLKQGKALLPIPHNH